MARSMTHQQPICYCHIAHQFYYPQRVVNWMSVCPYCDAYGATRADHTYQPDAPQWHALLNAVDVLKTNAQRTAEYCS